MKHIFASKFFWILQKILFLETLNKPFFSYQKNTTLSNERLEMFMYCYVFVISKNPLFQPSGAGNSDYK